MDKIYQLTQQLAANGSRTFKEETLRNYSDQEYLKTILRLAYDPFITFGITDFTDSIGSSGAGVLEVLNRCSTRELSGGAARSALGSALKGAPKGVQALVKNILNKDLRCGVSEKTIHKLYPGLIRKFDVMRAEKYTPVTGATYVEPKYDGLRCIAFVDGSSVTLLSRNGKEFTAADHLKPILAQQAANLGSRVFDGELIAEGGFNASVSSVKRKSSTNVLATFVCFEVIPIDEWNSENPVPYELRRLRLTDSCREADHFRIAPSFLLSAESVFPKYLEFLNQGLEGAIVKKPDGLYHFKRHTDWMKLKEACDVDLVVVDIIEGEGRLAKSLGAAVVDYKGKRVNVGSGWSDKERKHYWMYKSQLLGHTIEVQYHQETPDGSLRHPRFIKMRPDKD